VTAAPGPEEPVLDPPAADPASDPAASDPADAPEQGVDTARQIDRQPSVADGGQVGEPTEQPVAAQLPAEPPPAEPALPGETVSLFFNLEKIAGHGEDSDPILSVTRNVGVIGVFDGMGGAGGTVYQTPDGPRTGAYLASRVVRKAVEGCISGLLGGGLELDGPAAAETMQVVIKEALATRLADLQAPPSGLRSKLLRALPTTMALAVLQRPAPDAEGWTCHLFWAGDSRVYLFLPGTGSSQLTVDDLRDRGDAMANLREDSVVSNALSADTPFVVHHRKLELAAPFVVLAATDGCFGYLPTPMHFEQLVLSCLRNADNTESWSRALQSEITAVTGDDAAMSLLGMGADLEQFRDHFALRTVEVEQQWVAPLDRLAAELNRAEQELARVSREQTDTMAALWAAYKPEYVRYLGNESPKEEMS